MSKHEFLVPEEAAGLRLDQCLGRYVAVLSRSSARVALDLGAVFVDKKRVKVASRRMRAGQHVVVHLGGAFERAQKSTGRAARAVDEGRLPAFTVCFEDEHLVVVHKPAGLLSAPTPEGDAGNLQSLLARRRGAESTIYVVQRLDLQTSGVMVFTKTPLANERLSALFREHALTRRYEVFAAGDPGADSFSVDAPLRDKKALTHFARRAQYPLFCHLEATLETGRTHQIRLHLLARGLPVLADPKYARREPWHPPRLALHAGHLAFEHPLTQRALEFDSPLPDDLRSWLEHASGARELDAAAGERARAPE